MLPLTQRFGDGCLTLRASLARPTWVDSLTENTTFETYPFQQREELPKRRINTLLAEHPAIETNRVEVFRKDCLCLVTKIVSRLKMIVFASIRNQVVKSRYLDLSFLPVLRTSLFSRYSALQQCQLALQTLQKLWAFNTGAVRDSQDKSGRCS